METLLQNVLPAVVLMFMLFLSALCLFAVVVIVRDIVHESARARRERRYEPIPGQVVAPPVAQPAPVPEAVAAPVAPVAVEAPKPEPVAVVEEPAVEEPVEAEADDEGAVTFSTHTLTMEEKYATLSLEYKRYFDEIVRHALSKEGVKEIKHTGSYDYKIGSYRVLRIMIKRGDIVCEFTFIDRDFADHVSASNVRMKQSATTIRIEEASAVGVAKDGIDRVCAQIAEDKEHKKELAREKRREKRRAQAEAEAAEAPKEELAGV